MPADITTYTVWRSRTPQELNFVATSTHYSAYCPAFDLLCFTSLAAVSPNYSFKVYRIPCMGGVV